MSIQVSIYFSFTCTLGIDDLVSMFLCNELVIVIVIRHLILLSGFTDILGFLSASRSFASFGSLLESSSFTYGCTVLIPLPGA